MALGVQNISGKYLRMYTLYKEEVGFTLQHLSHMVRAKGVASAPSRCAEGRRVVLCTASQERLRALRRRAPSSPARSRTRQASGGGRSRRSSIRHRTASKEPQRSDRDTPIYRRVLTARSPSPATQYVAYQKDTSPCPPGGGTLRMLSYERDVEGRGIPWHDEEE